MSRRHLPYRLLAALLALGVSCAVGAAPHRAPHRPVHADVPAEPDALRLEPVAAVRVDADHDTVPDRKGEIVRLRGVVTLPAGALRTDGLQVTMQDATGGLGLFNRTGGPALKEGDRIEAWGEVAQYKGAVQLQNVRVRVLGRAAVPAPLRITAAQADSGAEQGRRVQIEGTTGELALDGYGLLRLTGRDGSPVNVFIPAGSVGGFDWKRYRAGTRVRATGVMSMFKASWPYDGGYQVMVHDPAGLEVLQPPPPAWHAWIVPAAALGLGLVLVATVAFATLQRRQRARQRELQTLSALSSSLGTAALDEMQLAHRACEILTAYGITAAAMVQVFDGEGSLRQIAVATADPRLGDALQNNEPVAAPQDGDAPGRHIEARVAGMGLGLMAVHPLHAQSGALGFLIALSPRRRRPNQMQERTLLAAVKLLAMALDNCRVQARARDEQRELHQLAITDDLTRLHNRRFLDEYLRVQVPLAQRRGAGLAFIAIDVDHFKRVNDTHGHDVGDQVLVGIAGLLRDVGRGSDLAVRLGGEEFLVVVHEHEVARALAVAERVRAAVEAQVFGEAGGAPLRATISAGVALFGMHGTDTAALLRASDEAMYRSKHAGRNCVTLATAAEPVASPEPQDG